MMNRLLLLITAALLTLNASSQQKYEYLWRISGPDLEKDSYLFGTVHLADDRVYNFSDSVLLAFESVDILAKELSRADIFEAGLRARKDKRKQSNFREEFSEEEYEKIRESFLKRTQFDLDKMPNANPVLINQLLREAESEEKNSAEYVLDQYFEEYALRMKKQVVGLEKPDQGIRANRGFSDPMEREFFKLRMLTNFDSLMNTMSFNQRSIADNGLNELVKRYQEGELAAFDKEDREDFMTRYSMEERNTIMVNGLDTLMQQGSVFCAVGISHLPGELGVIKKLENKGYKLEVVDASFTGITEEQMQKFEKLPSGKIERILQGYSAEMGGTAEDVSLPNSNIRVLVHQNRNTGSGQLIMTFEQGDIFSSTEEQLDLIVENYQTQNNFEIQSVENIKHDNVKGRQIILSSPIGFEAVMWIFTTNGHAYVFMEIMPSVEDFKAKKSPFFKSIKFFPINQFSGLSWENDLVEIPELRTKLLLPTPYESLLDFGSPLELGSNEFMSTSTISAIDREKGYSLNVVQYSYPVGYHAQSTEFIHQATIEAYLEIENTESISKDTLYNDEQMYVYEVLSVADTGKIHVVSFVRGHIMQNMVVQNMGDLSPEQTRFLKEWELIPWESPVLSTQETDYYKVLKSGETKADEEYQYYSSIVDSAWISSSLDMNSGVSQDLIIYELNELTYFPNEDSLLNYFLVDTSYSYSEIIDGPAKFNNGYRYTYTDIESNLYKHVYLTWKNRHLYEINYSTAKDVNHDATDSIFSSLEILEREDEEPFDIFTSKSRMLKEALFSVETATYESALDLLGDYDLTASEASEILTSLKESSPPLFDDDWSYRGVIRHLLEENGLDSLSIAEDLFKANPSFEPIILGALSDLDTDEGYALYRKLFPLRTTPYDYRDFSGYSNKKEFVKPDMEQIMKVYLENPTIDNPIYVLEGYFEENPSDREALNEYGQFFVNVIEQNLDTFDIDVEYYYPSYKYASLVELALYAGVDPKSMNSTIKALEKTKDGSCIALAELIKIAQGKMIKPSDLENILNDPEKSGTFLLGFDILGKERFYELVSHEDQSKYELLSELDYEGYSEAELNFVESYSHLFQTEDQDEIQDHTVHMFYYTNEYDDGPQLASCVYDEQGRLIYSTIYIGQYDPENKEKSKTTVTDDFEEYYGEW